MFRAFTVFSICISEIGLLAAPLPEQPTLNRETIFRSQELWKNSDFKDQTHPATRPFKEDPEAIYQEAQVASQLGIKTIIEMRTHENPSQKEKDIESITLARKLGKIQAVGYFLYGLEKIERLKRSYPPYSRKPEIVRLNASLLRNLAMYQYDLQNYSEAVSAIEAYMLLNLGADYVAHWYLYQCYFHFEREARFSGAPAPEIKSSLKREISIIRKLFSFALEKTRVHQIVQRFPLCTKFYCKNVRTPDNFAA